MLHAHSPALCGWPRCAPRARHGIPLVYEIRAFWEDAAVGNGTGREGSLKYRLTRALENRVVAGADAVVAICEGLRDDLIARGIDGGQDRRLPNGVDLDAVRRRRRRATRRWRDELGLGDGPVIGFIGSFYDYEGLDDLIAAMPALLAAQPEARLLLVGGGPMEERAARRRPRPRRPRDAIRFVGRVPHDEVERYYALIDVLAYPRKASRLTELVTPLKPLEAMAQGKLVAASDVGGHRELIEDGVTGTLFAPDDPADCAARARRPARPARRLAGACATPAARMSPQRHDWARNVQSLSGRLPSAARPRRERPAVGRGMTRGRAARGRDMGNRDDHVATIAFDSSDAQDAAKPPISLHPAFPAIVALWFAALLGARQPGAARGAARARGRR